MKTRSQGNRWSERFRRGFGFLLAPMSIMGLILFIPAVTHASYAWHTFYGSNDKDSGAGIVLDENGNVYVTGYSNASWQGGGGANPLHAHSGDNDIVVVKLDPSGAYQWHTFYGGSGSDGGYGIALDGSGNVYVAGWSYSTWQEGAGTNPRHPHSGGTNSDIVVVKLNNNGVYQWHTFYGSSDYDGASSIAVDGGGSVYVAGTSKGSWQGDGSVNPLHGHNGTWDIAVLKLGNNGAYQWHTFYGSSDYDGAGGIAVDGVGSVYVAGTSEGSWQGNGGANPLHAYSGDRDIAVLKLDSSGAYQWHTFYGSSGYEQTYGIALDGNGNVHVTGESWATWQGNGGVNPLHAYSGNSDIAVLKLNSSGAYQWHTFYGSDDEDSGNSIAADENGNVYLTAGSSGSWQGDGGANPLRPYNGGSDIVVMKLASTGAYQWHTFYGAGDQDYGWGITVDGDGNVHVSGYSYGAWQGDGGENPLHAYSGSNDIAVLKLYGGGLHPGEGTIGTEMTITGSGYGTKKGKVLAGNVALKILEWSDSTIRALLSKALSPGTYEVTIQPKGASAIILEDAFTVMAPEIGSVNPTSGSANDEIVITGFFFGTKKGKIVLGGKNCKVLSWTMDSATGASEVHFAVPKGLGAGTHELKVTNGVGTDSTEFDVK